MKTEGGKRKAESSEAGRLTLHASRFTVFPAIDLRHGKVVRLAQGDPDRQTVYGDDPAAVAERWKAEGAEWLHVVNLDGAFGEAAMTNYQLLPSILASDLKIQFGGGLRDETSLRRALDSGVARAVIGTAAIENPALVELAVREFGPERIAVGIDACEGVVRIRGWREGVGIAATDLGKRLRGQGVEWCIFTDVARDGIGAGVNAAATAELAGATGLRVVASGGVNGIEDVRRVREAGLAGVIVGRALYEGQISLSSALHETTFPFAGDLAREGVRLRPPRLDEMAYLRWLWADEDTMRAVGGPVVLTDEQAWQWFAQMIDPGRPTDFFCLIFNEDAEPVGEVSFHQFDREALTAMFNVKVAAPRRGQGYGRAAMRLLLDYFFDRVGGRVMLDDLAPDNEVGQRTVLQFGFERDPSVTGEFRVRLTKEKFDALYRSGDSSISQSSNHKITEC